MDGGGRVEWIMFVKCVECDHILEDEEYLYKGKSYCDDCYRAIKRLWQEIKLDIAEWTESLLTISLDDSYIGNLSYGYGS